MGDDGFAGEINIMEVGVRFVEGLAERYTRLKTDY
jgi:hypothetical protein